MIGVLVGLLPLGITLGTAATALDVMHRLQPTPGSALAGLLDGMFLGAVGASAQVVLIAAGVA